MSQFKYGRNPRDPSVPVLRFEDYLTSAAGLPPAPEIVDRASKVQSWPMYMNGPDPSNPPASPNGVGDCEDARVGHFIQAATAFASTEVTVPDSSILKMYSAVSGYDPQTGANDNGSTTQAALSYFQKTGVADSTGKVHKAAGYAVFGDATDLGLMSQVLNTFGTVFVDINCPESAQQQFGQIWEYVPGSPIEGGHAIGLQQVVTDQPGIYHFTTWGALQKATISFVEHYTADAWAVVTEDWIRANGTTIENLDLAQLLSDMAYV